MKIKVFNKFNEELNLLWSEFEHEANLLPFQSFEWQKYWNQQVGQPEYKIDLCILVCHIDMNVRAIFPFGIKRFLGARVLEFLGADEADYSAPLLSSSMSSNEFKDIWAEVIKNIPTHDVIHFRNMPELIYQINNFMLENIPIKKSGVAYSSDLANSFEEYSKSLSRSMLKDNKRMIRRLSEMGKLEFLVIDRREEFNKIIEILIAQKEHRYISSGARNIFNISSVRRFYKNIYNLKAKEFNIHLSALTLDDEILSTHLGIYYKDQFFYLMPTFNHDKKWQKFSLGRIHLEKLTNWAIMNRVTKFDFTIGAESYKNIWCDNEMIIFRYLKIKSLRGINFYIYSLLLEYIKSNTTLKKIALKLLAMRFKSKN